MIKCSPPPLYILADCKKLPSNQRLDQETIEWIINQGEALGLVGGVMIHVRKILLLI